MTGVAVIGAGPYGLAVAAHLQDAGVQTTVFGGAMDFWDEHMPGRHAAAIVLVRLAHRRPERRTVA